MTFADLESHRATCKVCRLWSLCIIGERILEAAARDAAAQIAPMPKQGAKA